MKEKDNIIALDIGNTNIKAALFQGERFKKISLPTESLHKKNDFLDAMTELSGAPNVDRSIVSSVVPDFTSLCLELLNSISIRPSVHASVSWLINQGIDIAVNTPHTLGPDRVLSAIAAYDYFKEPCVSVDFGTATTVNFMDSKKRFTGGTIMPGVDMMNACLNEKTAALPLIDLRRTTSLPGRDTNESILSGILFGTAGSVERIIRDVGEMQGVPLRVAITGGRVDIVSPYLKIPHHKDHDLVLKGLKYVCGIRDVLNYG